MANVAIGVAGRNVLRFGVVAQPPNKDDEKVTAYVVWVTHRGDCPDEALAVNVFYTKAEAESQAAWLRDERIDDEGNRTYSNNGTLLYSNVDVKEEMRATRKEVETSFWRDATDRCHANIRSHDKEYLFLVAVGREMRLRLYDEEIKAKSAAKKEGVVLGHTALPEGQPSNHFRVEGYPSVGGIGEPNRRVFEETR